MSPEEYQKKVENQLVKEFLQTFYEKVGYYPVVIIKEKSNIDNTKTLTLDELASYFTPFLPTIYGRKHALGSHSRSRPLPELRFIFCHIARSMRYNLKEIGQYLGGRDHTTVLHGLATFKNLYETDEIFKKRYHDIINAIKKEYESSIVDYINQTQDKPQSNLFLGLLQGKDPAIE
jgi:hypothetical protein